MTTGPSAVNADGPFTFQAPPGHPRAAQTSMRNHHDQAVRMMESPLEYRGLPHHPLARVLLRVWRYPSFQPYASWALIQARKDVLVRRVTWDQRHPLADTPVTFGCEAVVETALHEALTSALRDIRLPPFVSATTAGIDGTTYGVDFGGYMRSARLSWWEQPPAEWAELGAWHEQAIARFDALLPASTPAARR